jgi:F0F1-type ATP synthase assembly protein I
MSYREGPMSVIRDRFQFGSYGFIAGVIVGLLLGWIFHGFVGFVVRFGLVILLLVPLVVVFLVWRRLSVRDRRPPVIETSAVVVETRPGREVW